MNKKEIANAGKQIGLSDAQVEALWCALQKKNRSEGIFSTILLYLGALIIFLAMTWFYTANLTSTYSLLISTFYAILFLGSGFYFWRVKQLKIPGGVLTSLGIVMIPLILYSLQSIFGQVPFSNDYSAFYRWISGKWVLIEIGTLLAACLVFYFIRFAFITVLIYGTLAFMTMDVVHLLAGSDRDPWGYYCIAAMSMGVLLNTLAFILYRKELKDFGFWSYLFGMLLFSSGLNCYSIEGEWEHFIYLIIHCALLFMSGFFHRKIFLFFGFLGVIRYLGHLTYIFSDSLLFSYILAGIGFAIIMFASVLKVRVFSRMKKIDR